MMEVRRAGSYTIPTISFQAPRENTGEFAAVTGALQVQEPNPAAELLDTYAPYAQPWNPKAAQGPGTSIFNALAQEWQGPSSPRQDHQRLRQPQWSRLSPELGERLIRGIQGIGQEAHTQQWTPPVEERRLRGVLQALKDMGTGTEFPPAPEPLPAPVAIPPALESKVEELLDAIEERRSSEFSTPSPQGPVVADTIEMERALGCAGRIVEDLRSGLDEDHTPWWMREEFLPEPDPVTNADHSVTAGLNIVGIPDFLNDYASGQPAIMPGPRRPELTAPAYVPGNNGEVFSSPETAHGHLEPRLLQTSGQVANEDRRTPPAATPNHDRVSKAAAVVGAAVLVGVMAFRRFGRRR